LNSAFSELKEQPATKKIVLALPPARRKSRRFLQAEWLSAKQLQSERYGCMVNVDPFLEAEFQLRKDQKNP